MVWFIQFRNHLNHLNHKSNKKGDRTKQMLLRATCEGQTKRRKTQKQQLGFIGTAVAEL